MKAKVKVTVTGYYVIDTEENIYGLDTHNKTKKDILNEMLALDQKEADEDYTVYLEDICDKVKCKLEFV